MIMMIAPGRKKPGSGSAKSAETTGSTADAVE
jgi:hypothetical protein